MNTQTTLASNDLILRLAGGQRDGELISVSTTKCMLGLKNQQDANRSPASGHCSIYRGPAGVAVQSHGNDVLVNGEATSVHWLRQGDRIQLPNSHAVEVLQLGSVAETPYPIACPPKTHTAAEIEAETTMPVDICETQTYQPDPQPGEFEAAEFQTVETPAEAVGEEAAAEYVGFQPGAELSLEDSVVAQPEAYVVPAAKFAETEDNAAETYSAVVDGDRIDFIDQDATADSFAPEATFATEQECESHSTANTPELDERFESLESSIESIRNESSNVDQRFDRLENTLNDLTDKLERLTSLALDTRTVAEPAESAVDTADAIIASVDTPEPTVEPMAVEVVPSVTSDQVSEPVEVSDTAEDDNANDELQQVFAKLSEPTSAPTTSEIETVAEPVVELPFAVAEETPAEDKTPDLQSLFSELSASVEPASETAFEETAAEPIAAADEPIVPEFTQLPSETSDLQSVAPLTGDTPAESETTGLAERLLNSIREDDLEAEGLPEAESAEAFVAEPVSEEPGTPAEVSAPLLGRTPIRTASVAEIFARLHAESEGGNDLGVKDLGSAPPASNESSFAEVQASLTAAFEQELPPVEADSDLEQKEAVAPLAPETPEVETSAVETPVAEPETNEAASKSVSDMMARLREGGDLDSDEQNEPESNTAETGPSNEATLNPPRQQQDSVTDYMSLLLSRMQGNGNEIANTSDVPVAAAVNQEQVQTTDEPATDANTGVMTEDEFLPKQKPVQIASFDKMRELANASSRSAIDRSIKAQKHERSRSLILQSVSVGSLALGGIFVLSQSYYCATAFLGIFALSFGYFCYETVKPMMPTQIDNKTAKADESVATTEATVATEE